MAGNTTSSALSVFDQLMAGTAHAKPQGSVEAPELGEGQVVHFASLGVGAAVRLNLLKEQGKDGLTIARELFPLAVCKADGSPYFDAQAERTEEERRRIDAVPLSLVMRVVEAATQRMKEDAEAAKKRSVGTPGSAS